jgi:DNA-binding NarL/FixJ family response regulator
LPAGEPQRLAASVRNARYVVVEGDCAVGSYAASLAAVDSFLSDLDETLTVGDSPPGIRTASGGSDNLTPREIDVLRLIARGRSNQQIAEELVLSVRTVERHITNLYAKIGAHGKADATAYALRNGLA